jgi:carbamoylphosphate synthase small subunit
MEELQVFGAALTLNIPMAGICRGGQFLNVVCGGAMWQHVDNHAIGGTHPVLDFRTGKTFNATSTHHQMMRPGEDGIVLAVASPKRTRDFYAGHETIRNDDELQECEVVYYPVQQALCFQPHPEIHGYPDLQDWYFQYLNDYLFTPSWREKHERHQD